MRYLKIFSGALAAGVCISVGGTVLLSLKDGTLFGGVCGAVLFSLGLLTIVTRKLNLFTGKIGYLLSNKPSYIIDLAVIWIGNFTGTALCGTLLRFTRVGAALAERAETMCRAKLDDSVLSMLILSFFCGVLMYIAVDGYKRLADGCAGVLIVILPVAVFILCGFEHVVANMFYFAVSASWGIKTFAYLLLMTLGNGLGSITFAVLDNICHKE